MQRGNTEATLRMYLRGGWRQTHCLCLVVYRGPSLPVVAKIASITKDGEDSPNPTSREHQNLVEEPQTFEGDTTEMSAEEEAFSSFFP